jgi:pyruvate carboxylase
MSIASVRAESTPDPKGATKVPPPSRLQKRMESEMENPIKAPRDCVIKSVEVKKGQDVQNGAVLITLEQP